MLGASGNGMPWANNGLRMDACLFQRVMSAGIACCLEAFRTASRDIGTELRQPWWYPTGSVCEFQQESMRYQTFDNKTEQNYWEHHKSTRTVFHGLMMFAHDSFSAASTKVKMRKTSAALGLQCTCPQLGGMSN